MPPLCKGRWTTRKRRTEGLSCPRDADLYNPPASLRSASPKGFSPGRRSAEGGDEGDGKGTAALLDPSSVTSCYLSQRRKERRRQRSRFLPTMAKASVRCARTPHGGDAHNAQLTPRGKAFIPRPLPLARRSLHSTAFRVRDDTKKGSLAINTNVPQRHDVPLRDETQRR